MIGHKWPWQKIELRYFSPLEFDHPEVMDADFLLIIDEWRDRCGFPIKVLDDGRTESEHLALYRRVIEAGGKAPNSSHLRGCAIDCRPLRPSEARELTMVGVAYQMWQEGRWPHLGVEVATRHLHFDSDPHLARDGRRPVLFAAVSR